MRRAYILAACAGLAAAWLAAEAPGAVAVPPQIVSVRVGFADGSRVRAATYYKPGTWTPVEVELAGGSERLTGEIELTVPDAAGVPCTYRDPSRRRVLLLPGKSVRRVLYARFPETPLMRVTFRTQAGVACTRQITSDDQDPRLHLPPPLGSGARLLLVLGPSIGLERAYPPSADSDQAEVAVVRLAGARQLPTRWYGLEGVDAVVVSTSRPELLRNLREGDARVRALAEWVQMGGRLIVCAGARAEEVLAPGMPLARFAPGQLLGVIDLAQGAALEAYTGLEAPRPIAPRGEPLRLLVPRFAGVRGKVEAAEGGLPLVVRTPWACGEVVFVGVDLDRRPLADWPSRTAVVRRLLEGRPQRYIDAPAPSAAARVLGYEDLAGQLYLALDEFDGVRVVPFWLVALLVLVYVAMIGPLDYLLVKYGLRRMEATWITFPLIVLGVSGAAYGAAVWLKGDQVRMNQADLVDVDLESGVVRGTTWLNVYSPQAHPYQLRLQPTLSGTSQGTQPNGAGAGQQPRSTLFVAPSASSSRSGVLLGWAAPVSGGRPLRQAPAAQAFAEPYVCVPEAGVLEQLPIPVWSSRAVMARWWGSTASPPLEVEVQEQADGSLAGRLRNTLPGVTLRECLLAGGTWAWLLGDLKPGDRVAVRPEDQRDLEGVLRNWRLVRQEGQFDRYVRQGDPYNTESADVPYILQAMLFYQAAGGRSFVRLDHHQWAFTDLSRHLAAGRAILLAKVAEPAAQVDSSGGNALRRTWTVWRFILPVQPAPQESGP
jgi:hypothetical protein